MTLLDTLTGQRNPLKPFYGVYRGFSPTDESPIGMGELEISISRFLVHVAHATGLTIQRETISTRHFRPMTQAELSSLYPADSLPDKMTGFSVRGMRYFFVEDAGLMISGNELADLLGPTLLFGPKQILKGEYELAVKELEVMHGKNCFPTLKAKGRLHA